MTRIRVRTLHAFLCTLCLALAPLTACGGDDGGAPTATGGTATTGGMAWGGSVPSGGELGSGGTSSTSYSYNECREASDVGGFTIELADTYTRITGKVTDAVIASRLPETVTVDGDCELVRSRNLFCDPECAVGENCGEDGQCVADPTGQDAGEVTITGLKDAVSMTPRAGVFNYDFVGTLTHPGFDEGDVITLTAAGGSVGPFQLVAKGITALDVDQTELPLVDGMPAVVTWNASTQSSDSRVLAELNIALHGGNPVRIECDVPDNGRLEISAALVSELLGYGFSGFPAITVTRQTADSVTVPGGCANLRVVSTVSRLPVTIDGLISCSDPGDCPDGQTCQADLTCG